MESINAFLNHPDLYYYLLIPVFSGLIGWITNAIGIQMMFSPQEFVGIRPIFGWQGIIPAKAGKFARLQMEQIEKIVDINSLLDRVDPDEVAAIIQPGMRRMTEELTDEVASQNIPFAWENTPNFIKERLYKRMDKDFPKLFDNLYKDLRNNIDTLFDSKQMVIEKLTNEKHILADLIHQTIDKELKFLVKSGLYLGFLFGIGQMILWYNFPDTWYVLPIGGFLVGYLTNWIAVKLMFRPINPIKIGPFTLHGLFLKRKDEVAKDYAKTLTTSVLDAKSIADYILRGTASDQLYKLLQRHFKAIIDSSMGIGKPLVMFSVGTENYIQMKNKLCDRITEDMRELPQPLQEGLAYTEKAMALESEIEVRMRNFSSLEFDGFVRPIFEQDEWILYAVGGALGFVAGWCQLITMFS